MHITATDEAGYGPNLGPLVITATQWLVPPDCGGDLTFLFEPLRQAGFPVGDSKKIYHGANTFGKLEHTVLAAIEHQSAFDGVLQHYGVQLLDVQSRIIEPAEFNRLLETYNSKGSLLSNETMKVIQTVYRADSGLYLCDKHGGRNHYLDLLTDYYPDEFVVPMTEGRERSVYRFSHTQYRFLAKGESQLPIALSSMVSKYRRELAMQKLNEFWQEHVPGLIPTAGYPVDAVRFYADIRDARINLGIADDTMWRKK